MDGHEPRTVLMLGTFGLTPKATMSARALAIGQALGQHGWSAVVGTTPWDSPADAGRSWSSGGVEIRNTRVTRPALWPLAAGEMIGWARSIRPRVVHLFKPKGFGDLASRWLRRSFPVVVDMDDWEGDGGWNDSGLYGPLQRRVFNWQETTWPPLAPAITVASRALERRAIDLGASPDRVHYVPNGLTRQRLETLRPDPARYEAVAGALQANEPRILLYTRFVEFRTEDLARAFQVIQRSEPDAELVVAGRSHDGRAEGRLTERMEAAGLGGRLRALGWIDPDALGTICACCSVAIHPFDDTTLNRAKASVKLLELMGAGMPVVATAVGENAEYIEHEQTGLLVPPGQPEAIAAAVLSLLGDRARAKQIGSRARARVEREYLWEGLVPRVLGAYEQAVSARAATRPARRSRRREQVGR